MISDIYRNLFPLSGMTSLYKQSSARTQATEQCSCMSFGKVWLSSVLVRLKLNIAIKELFTFQIRGFEFDVTIY